MFLSLLYLSICVSVCYVPYLSVSSANAYYLKLCVDPPLAIFRAEKTYLEYLEMSKHNTNRASCHPVYLKAIYT